MRTVLLYHIYTERQNRPHSPTQSESLTRAGERDETTAATIDKSEMGLKIWSPSI